MSTSLITTRIPKVPHGSLLAPWMWKRIRKLPRSLVRYVRAQHSIASVFLTLLSPTSGAYFNSYWFMRRNCVNLLVSNRKNTDNTQTRSPSHRSTTTPSWCRPKWTSFRGVMWVYCHSHGYYCRKSLYSLKCPCVIPTLIAFLPCRSSTRRVWRRSIRSTLCIPMCLSSSKPSAMPTTSAT